MLTMEVDSISKQGEPASQALLKTHLPTPLNLLINMFYLVCLISTQTESIKDNLWF